MYQLLIVGHQSDQKIQDENHARCYSSRDRDGAKRRSSAKQYVRPFVWLPGPNPIAYVQLAICHLALSTKRDIIYLDRSFLIHICVCRLTASFSKTSKMGLAEDPGSFVLHLPKMVLGHPIVLLWKVQGRGLSGFAVRRMVSSVTNLLEIHN